MPLPSLILLLVHAILGIYFIFTVVLRFFSGFILYIRYRSKNIKAYNRLQNMCWVTEGGGYREALLMSPTIHYLKLGNSLSKRKEYFPCINQLSLNVVALTVN